MSSVYVRVTDAHTAETSGRRSIAARLAKVARVLSPNTLDEADPDAGKGVFDTATVAGNAWTRHYV